MIKKQRISPTLDTPTNPELDQLLRKPQDLWLVIFGAGPILHSEQKRQLDAGLVSEFGQLVIDGTLLIPGEAFAMGMSEGLKKAVDEGWLIAQGERISSQR